ncbi:MAG: SDR family NAD(P)-dependent oxidoreductase [Pseudomonadota bacterium]
MSETPDLQDRVALVTGATRGFGFATARALAAAGAHVIAVGRTVGGLEDLDNHIKQRGGTATLVPLDVTDDPGLMRLGGAVYDRFGRVDLWLHTAAHAPFLSRAAMISEKDLDATLALNLRAYQRLIRCVDPLLRLAPAHRGRALIATEDRIGQPFWGLYAAAKAAQSVLTRAWAEETRAEFTVAEIVPPEMPTALRGRFYPSPERDKLATIDAAAEALLLRLSDPISPGERIVLMPNTGEGA